MWPRAKEASEKRTSEKNTSVRPSMPASNEKVSCINNRFDQSLWRTMMPVNNHPIEMKQCTTTKEISNEEGTKDESRDSTMGRRRNSTSVLLLWALLLVLTTTLFPTSTGLQNILGSRRQFVATVTTAAGTLVAPQPSVSESATAPEKGDSLSSQLLSMIPVSESGAPATNATLPTEVASKIEDFVAKIEKTAANKNNIESPLLSGSWRLLYSNAPEIVGLAKGLPLGFVLGPTYQPLDTAKGFFENTALLDHPNKLARLQTVVVGTIQASPNGSLNAAGVVNDRNNRVIVNFEAIAFEVDTLLGKPLQTPIRKTIVPKAVQEGTPLPANDQTYLDKNVRIVRGGDGSLFVFCRDTTFMPRSAEERAEILASKSSSTTLVGPDLEQANSKEIPVEIEYLFRE